MRKSIVFLLCAFTAAAQAQIKLPAFFSDNMVLQQRSLVKIWGYADAGQPVKIGTSWDKKHYRTRTGTLGKWQVIVHTPLAGGPYVITIAGKNKIKISNVLIGEVWICSGQSNMDMPVKGYVNLPVVNSNDILMDSPDDGLRLFHVGQKYATTPQSDVKGSWLPADAGSVYDFSAVGYQFAKFIRRHLQVPVGIIQATCGGSPIEAWMDKQLVTDVLKDSLNTDKAISAAMHRTPANLYNGMISPLTGYGIAGVIWYQGEQNRYNYYAYQALQLAMVKSWRKSWGTFEWPFDYVQIAPMRYFNAPQAYGVPRLREAQLNLLDSLPNSEMIVSIDAGEEHNIHPANKSIIARRLAYSALGKTYGKKGIAYKYPRFSGLTIDNDTLRIKFKDVPNGMTTFGKTITQFEVAGTSKVFYPAIAILRNNVVYAYSTMVPHPVAARYAFKDWAVGELYNTEGLPVSPFRTDEW